MWHTSNAMKIIKTSVPLNHILLRYTFVFLVGFSSGLYVTFFFQTHSLTAVNYKINQVEGIWRKDAALWKDTTVTRTFSKNEDHHGDNREYIEKTTQFLSLDKRSKHFKAHQKQQKHKTTKVSDANENKKQKTSFMKRREKNDTGVLEEKESGSKRGLERGEPTMKSEMKKVQTRVLVQTVDDHQADG